VERSWLDLAGRGAQRAEMGLSTRHQDIYNALLASIIGDIKSHPRLRQFKKSTKDQVKLSGLGKIVIPVVVWDMLKDDASLTNEWEVRINEGPGTSPEFTMTKR